MKKFALTIIVENFISVKDVSITIFLHKCDFLMHIEVSAVCNVSLNTEIKNMRISLIPVVFGTIELMGNGSARRDSWYPMP